MSLFRLVRRAKEDVITTFNRTVTKVIHHVFYRKNEKF